MDRRPLAGHWRQPSIHCDKRAVASRDVQKLVLDDAVTRACFAAERAFLQVLEGAAQDLDRLMTRLAGDPRHDEVVVIERKPIPARGFSGWAMASVRVTPALEETLRATVDGAGAPQQTVERMQDAVLAQAA